MATLSFRQIALIVVAAVALSVLYYLSQSVDLDRQARTQDALQNLKHWDAVLKRDVLRTRTGLLNHYDTLVSTINSIKSAHNDIADISGRLPSGNDGALKESLKALGEELVSRGAGLERFKLHNSILRNSLSFLPVAASRITERLSSAAETAVFGAELNGMLRNALLYNLSGEAGLNDELRRAVAVFSRAAEDLDADLKPDVDNVLAHVLAILTQKPVLDRIVANLLNVKSSALIDDVARHYNTAFMRLEERAEMYRSMVFVLAVLTVLYVAFVLMQLNRAATSLEAANTELEARVAARTAELSETNSELRIHLDRIGLAMEQAERGDMDIQLPEVVEGVYATLYRRFNHMIVGIRDEAEILKVAQELSGELKLDALLARIMGTTTDLLDADRSTIFVHDRNSNELWSRVAEGVDVKEIRIPDNAGIAGKVFESRAAENVADPYAHELFNPEIDRATGYKTESILCMPIIDRNGEAIGVTQVLNKSGGEFLARDEARLRAFTAQVSISLANAQLFADVTREKNYNEATLNSLSNGVITFGVDTLVTTANPAAARIFGRDVDELIGMDAATVFGGRRGWVTTQVTELLRTGKIDNFLDVDLQFEDGTSASVNLTVVPLRDGDNEIIGGMLILEDITSEKRVKSTMARYMTREIAEQLMEAGEDALGGRSQTATVLFSDIRRFTSISEKLGPRDTVAMLNEYFTEMIEVIFKNKGILDKYIGDAIMAVFGTPFPTPDDTDNAIIVANRMIEVLRELNLRRRSEGNIPIDIGIGLSTGDLISGNIGSLKRMDYTVIGDTVNLAARLESATKYYGVPVLASEYTVAGSNGQHQFRELDLIVVKGKTEPVAVYEALGHHNAETFVNMQATLAAFEQGLKNYRNRAWDRAIADFGGALELRPDDGPSTLYLERCEFYRDMPPPSDWRGVWEMIAK